MPRDPRRDYEYKITKAVRQIIESDDYFKQVFKNKRTGSFEVSEDSLLLDTQPIYPAISVYFENEVLYNRKNISEEIRPSIYIDVGFQASTQREAKKQTFLYLKDIKSTLWCKSNLLQMVDGEPVQVAFSEVASIEPSFFENKDSMWTYITTMELRVLSY